MIQRLGLSSLVLIVVIGFLLRIFDLSYPSFTLEEARFASRAYWLVSEGTDELGRRYPIIFNSFTDYQLPVTSYITALGILVFGKNDFGARIPFVILGCIIVFLTFHLSEKLLKSRELSLLSSLIVAVSPPLIYLSRVPNEIIPLVCLNLILMILLFSEGKKIVLILFIFILTLLTHKFAWIISFPLMLVILISNKEVRTQKNANYFFLFCFIANYFIVS